ncbi:hypothetical protein [Streptomyces zingiberis]|uniref:Uncharacterized protein n=1 Tax=Streptomyces zingiberis TaxID=2053010 RepID=A0ABX1BXV4_9ACTN|nr:hypothetical protein [Streptomyces zingiberis]NJQ01258.1 hypothetical protein [Streptomyces zingiberis]
MPNQTPNPHPGSVSAAEPEPLPGEGPGLAPASEPEPAPGGGSGHCSGAALGNGTAPALEPARTRGLPHPAGPRFLAPKLREALAARDALAAALTSAGIQLPAMDIRTPWGDALPDDAPDQPRTEEADTPAPRAPGETEGPGTSGTATTTVPATRTGTPGTAPGTGMNETATPDGAAHRTPDSARYALVHLGVCSAPVAQELAAVIARGAIR